jgi:hypothetical protein
MREGSGTRRWRNAAAALAVSSCCGGMSPTVRAQNPVFDEPFVNKAIISAELSLLVKDETPVNPDALLYPFFAVSQKSGDNRALVAKTDGTCYVAYKGRVPGFFEDLLEGIFAIFSFGLFSSSDVCLDDDCCQIRTPVQKDFRSLQDEVGALVDACRATCGGAATPCPLILTGHQQGSYSTTLDFATVNFTHNHPPSSATWETGGACEYHLLSTSSY